MKLILAFFGYVKVPIEAIQLSMVNEGVFKSMVKTFDDQEIKNHLKKALEGQRAITKYLRSGRKLGR